MNHTRRSVGKALAVSGLMAASPWVRARSVVARLTMVVFDEPSLGAFLQPVIKQRKLDLAHGIDLNFVQRTPDAYTLEFNSGEYQIGGSAALLSIGVARDRGIKVSYLFNLNDYFGAVVTSRKDIRTLHDLAGKHLAASTATTNFAMFRWLMQSEHVSLKDVSLINTAPPGLIGYALADRADAVELWEPAYSQLIARKPSLRSLDLQIREQWERFSPGTDIPYLGVAAHDEWIARNPDLVKRLFHTFVEASKWVRANPDAAARLIAPSLPGSEVGVLRTMIASNKTLRMNVMDAAQARAGIEAVYRAGLQSGYLSKPVDPASIYSASLS